MIGTYVAAMLAPLLLPGSYLAVNRYRSTRPPAYAGRHRMPKTMKENIA